MKALLIFMGRGGTGKSYLEHNLTTRFPDVYRKVVSVTTRPPRQGETHGKDYYFVNNNQFSQLSTLGALIQETEFAGHKYGSLSAEYDVIHPPVGILVMTPENAVTFIPLLKEKYYHMKIVTTFFDITTERLKANMRHRGDSEESISKRIQTDTTAQDFKSSELIADITITDNILTEALPEYYHFTLVRKHLQSHVYPRVHKPKDYQ